MSYRSFAKEEMRRANTDAQTQQLVFWLLDIVDRQEHSGGSMSIYSQYVQGIVARGVLEHLPVEYRPVFADVDVTTAEGKERVVDAMMILTALMVFEPLTPLLGDADEWINVYDDSYQNTRCPTVFKDGEQGQAYRIDQILFSYPASDYRGWVRSGRGNKLSAQAVTFPYDVSAPENKRRVHYYPNESWLDELPTGIDVDVWLAWMRDRYIKGIDPTTNQVREDVMFLRYEESEHFTTMLRNVLCYVKYTKGQPLDVVKQKLGWLHNIQEHFALDWVEHEMEGDGVRPYKAVFTHPEHGGQLLRMLTLLPKDIQYMVGSEDAVDAPFVIDKQYNEYHLRWRHVVTESGRYQGWEHSGHYVPVWALKGEDIEPFFYDAGQQILGDDQDYLYQKRRALGLAHPRNRSVARVSIPEDCTTPDVVVDSPVKGHPGEPLSEQEANDIDHAVSRHVKSVFNNPKKD